MGPGKDFEKGLGIMHTPVFEPDQDLLVWRKKVASWVDLIATAASKGNDNFYKTVFCTLGRHLYDRGLRQAQQSLVDEAQEQGKIDYRQEDQVKAVHEIVDLVAQDPPIAVVTRLIDSFNKVTSCKHKSNEDLNRFVSRFHGLVAEHLMRAGSSNHSQIS